MIEEQVDFDRSVEAVIEWVESNSSWDDTLLIVTADHECGYLTGPGSDPQWHAPVGRGQGMMPEVEWHSAGHTNSLVSLIARGAVAESLQSHVRGEDPVWGAYTDNTDLTRVLFSALGPPQ
jgi:alkaline phosphatase